MNRDSRHELVIAALIVSAIVHVALMFWARPKVMTRVAQGVARLVSRGPMRVTEAAARPEPVKIEVVKDEEPEKDSPEVAETVALVPSADTSLPVPSESGIKAAAAMPELLARLRPESAAPQIEFVKRPPSPVKPAALKLETPDLGLTPASRIDLPDPGTITAPSAPSFEAPVFSALEPSVATVYRLEPRPRREQEFKPVEAVMEKVDEQVVEQEKAAVRELLDAPDALDLAEAVSVALTTAAAEGYVYFKATLAPKMRLPVVPKDVVVILDASGSIGNDRLASCRKAARRILRTATNTGDRFNLVAFRDRFSYAFREWRECDQASFDAGDRWLSNLAAHGRTDVFATISSVLTLPRDPKRPLIALVVTDGDANSGVRENAAILSKFSRLNDGLISVYMYGVKSSANAELIDVLTRGNRGESFIFGGSRWSAGAGIEELSERFRDPLLTDLRVVFAAGCEAEAYPALLKNLYHGNTVDIVGRVKGNPGRLRFSLRALSGEISYEGFFDLPLGGTVFDASLPARWQEERAIDARLR